MASGSLSTRTHTYVFCRVVASKRCILKSENKSDNSKKTRTKANEWRITIRGMHACEAMYVWDVHNKCQTRITCKMCRSSFDLFLLLLLLFWSDHFQLDFRPLFPSPTLTYTHKFIFSFFATHSSKQLHFLYDVCTKSHKLQERKFYTREIARELKNSR